MKFNQVWIALSETASAYSKENICNAIQQNESVPETGSFGNFFDSSQWGERTCEGIEDYKAKLTWREIDLVKNGNLSITESVASKQYALNIDGTGSDSNQASQYNGAKALGFKFNMTIEMPGTIQSASAGTISEDRKSVQIDLLDSTALRDGIQIKSEESNSLPVMIGGIAAIAIIGGIAHFFFLRKP